MSEAQVAASDREDATAEWTETLRARLQAHRFAEVDEIVERLREAVVSGCAGRTPELLLTAATEDLEALLDEGHNGEIGSHVSVEGLALLGRRLVYVTVGSEAQPSINPDNPEEISLEPVESTTVVHIPLSDVRQVVVHVSSDGSARTGLLFHGTEGYDVEPYACDDDSCELGAAEHGFLADAQPQTLVFGPTGDRTLWPSAADANQLAAEVAERRG